MYVEGSLEKCIRVMIFINDDKDKENIRHIYLKKAKNLRKDLNYMAEEPNL